MIAFLFTRMGLLRIATATFVRDLSDDHLSRRRYSRNDAPPVFQWHAHRSARAGASFSALEIVPLVLIGFEAYENLTLSRAKAWVAAYRWPILFFVAVAFWNLVVPGCSVSSSIRPSRSTTCRD